MNNNTDLINNTLKIDKILSKTISKRLKKELQNLHNLYHEIDVELIPNSENLYIIVYDFNEGKKVCFKFLISVNYPFVCPTVFFNNFAYKRLLICVNNYETKNLKDISGYDCLCCQSITCGANWSPGYMLTNIINEINIYKKIKRDILLKMFADKIKRKYLIEDIDLDCLLFNR